MKNKLMNQRRERCLVQVGVFPKGSMVWHHPHCAFNHQQAEDVAALHLPGG